MPSLTVLKIIAGTIYLTVSVAGLSAHALLDSGAAISILTPDFAQQVGVKSANTATMITDAGRAAASIASGVDMKIGGSDVRLINVLIADLSELVDASGPKIDLLLGQDVIMALPMRIDFGHDQLQLLQPGELAALPAQGFRKLPLERDREGRWYTYVRLAGLPPTKATVDLGSNTALLIEADFARHTRIDQEPGSSTGLVGDVSGVQVTKAFSLRQIGLGPTNFEDVPVDAVPVWRSPQPITIGLPLLRQFDIVFDLQHQSLWLRPLEHRVPIDRDLSGVLVAYRGQYLEVMHVAEKSPASEAGILIGDRIDAIDGKAIDEGYYLHELWRWRFDARVHKVILSTSRGKKLLELYRYY